MRPLPTMTLLTVFFLAALPAHGQTVLPANDGTGTIVNKYENRFNIEGGTLSADQTNLFHSFEQFGLNTNHIANFLSSPQIHNILGRVVGGDPSVINGLLQVMGGKSNLFLMNPAGIVFGPNARLNVPADFMATTATGIGFGNDRWFHAAGLNDYASLTGTPRQFDFHVDRPGSIVNTGSLVVSKGRSITLLGGQVVTTGYMEAPEGQITVTSVAGSNRVIISQKGSLLRMEIEPPRDGNGMMLPIAPTDLAVLLTEGAKGLDTGLKANEDGSVKLTEAGVTIPTESGTTIVSGSLDASGVKGGSINVLGRKVGVSGANINTSGNEGGGEIFVGGEFQGQGLLPNSLQTFVGEDSSLQADALVHGDGGRVIVWADEQTNFHGRISARGGRESGNGGFAEISGKEHLLFRGNADLTAPNGRSGTILFDPVDITIVEDPGESESDDGQITEDDQILFGDSPNASFTITESALEELSAEADVILEARNNITFEALSDDVISFSSGPDGSVRFSADADLDSKGNIQVAGSLFLVSQGGDITMEGAGFGIINNEGSLEIRTNGGDISVSSRIGAVPDNLFLVADSSSASGLGGAITINSAGDLFTDTLDASGLSGGGNINLTSANGGIDTSILISGTAPFFSSEISASSTNGAGGKVTMNAATGIITGGINTSGALESGTISLTGDEINVIVPISSSGSTLILQPATPGQVIVLGENEGTEALDLTSNDLANLDENLGLVTVGRENSTGTIRVLSPDSGELSLTNSFTLRSPDAGGTISIAGPIQTNGNAFFLNAGTRVDIDANISTLGGNLDIFSGGTIDSAGANLDTGSPVSGGTITLRSGNDITTSAISSTLSDQIGAVISETGGTILIDSGGSFTSGGPIRASSNQNNGANISLTAVDNIFTQTISSNSNESNGGLITLRSGGEIQTDFIDAQGFSGEGGTLELIATGPITTNQLDARGSAGGNITLTSQTGTLTVIGSSEFPAISSNAIGGEGGGTIRLTAGDAIDIRTDSGLVADLNSSGGTNGGTISLRSGTTITTGSIDTSGNADVGNGGNVTLGPADEIQVASINAQGGFIGNGGNIDINTQRFFRVTESFTDRNGLDTSLSSSGGTAGGSITIRHGAETFIIGDSTENGSQAAITSGTFTVAPNRSLPGAFEEGNIRIIGNLTEEDEQIVQRVQQIDRALLDDIREPKNTAVQLPIEDDSLTFIPELEKDFTTTYETYFDMPPRPVKTLNQIKNDLRSVEETTGTKPAVIYSIFRPTSGLADEVLELVLVTSDQTPVRRRISGATRKVVSETAEQFQGAVSDRESEPEEYVPDAQKLYDWLVRPLEKELKTFEVQHLIFVLDTGLRSLPLAALHNGKTYIIKDYSVGLMPSLSLTDMRYVDIRKLGMLAMGSTEFTDQEPLPAARLELQVIAERWNGQVLFDKDFTEETLKNARKRQPYRILHLATHANFRSGDPGNSYIQFWNKKLQLDQVRELKLNDPAVELLTFSACRTALGDSEAELGFTGLAVQAGVKSAVGSLWYVGDEGTLGLMTSFYDQLRDSPTKIKALQDAQLLMLEDKVRAENGQIFAAGQKLSIPGTISTKTSDSQPADIQSFTHPYYWSGFTIVGSPW